MEQQLKLLDELMALANENKLSELSIRFGDISVSFKKNQQVPISVAGGHYFNQHYSMEQTTHAKDRDAAVANELKRDLAAQKSIPANLSKIVSPLSGVFYRAPSPTSSPFVEIGQVITEGQVLCIIEAMKIMNEIISEFSGAIVQIFVQNGAVVEEGETLFLIDKGGVL